ncbi:amino acid/amide ABC transporter membrane protein 2, HAAT family [Desulfacinum hydrothermale DSM 13146]|uniref:Amino acid/amide ABC transporter membrane protein 2, HAAT family n=1 Tax=Desulfacinum hydrothermale DSM 13146 TaxID=1121390 RepID=A0A1W1XRL0_9BACT|nr:amino acid/amide ABC transporter membrane protein 2, HAAT family [Desulfacinum hydrothermale DSM 13146]
MSPPSSSRSIALLVVVGLTLVLWPAGGWHTQLVCRVLGFAFLYATVTVAWNLVALSGLISLGHAAYFGLGAYAAALLDRHVGAQAPVTLAAAGLCAAAYGLVVAVAFQRLRAASYALATLASVEIPKVIADNWNSFTLGSLGLVGTRPLPAFSVAGMELDLAHNITAQYYGLMALLALACILHALAIHSRWGWALRAVREDERAAAVLGVNVFATRLGATVLSAALTGLCGGLYAHLMGMTEPALVFNLHISAMPLVFAMLGGRFRWYGPVLGALVLYGADQLFLHPWLPAGHAAIYGLVIMVMLLFLPKGLGS